MLNIKFMKKYIFLLFILVTIAGQNYAQDANEPSQEEAPKLKPKRWSINQTCNFR